MKQELEGLGVPTNSGTLLCCFTIQGLRHPNFFHQLNKIILYNENSY